MKITRIALKKPRLFKRLNDPYRMVLINDQSLDEVASFQLTKSSVYVLFSTLFVLVIVITVAILLLTPMKYYIPGYGNNETRLDVIRLQQQVDSLNDLITAEQRQAADLRRVLSGDFKGFTDSTHLSPDQIRREAIDGILPQPEDVRQDALETARQETNHKKKRRKN